MKSSFLLSLASTGMFSSSSRRSGGRIFHHVRAFSSVMGHRKSSCSIQPPPTSSFFITSLTPSRNTHQHRFYAIRRNNNNDENTTPPRGFLSRVKRSARKWVPSFLQRSSKKERLVLQEQKQQRRDMEQGIKSLFRDAPFPIRMMGGIVSKMASSMVQQAAIQQEQIQVYYQQAADAIQNDSAVQQALGSNIITVGPPFSQSSSSSSINGVSSTTMEIGFPVEGGRGQRGIGRLVVIQQQQSTNTVQQNLQVQVNGRWIRVDPTASSSRGTGFANRFKAGMNSDVGDVIEAEIVTEKRNSKHQT